MFKRLKSIISSGFALAATPDAQAWKQPRPLGPDRPHPEAPQPAVLPDRPDTKSIQQPPSARPSREPIFFALGFLLVAAVGIWLLAKANPAPPPANPALNVAGSGATAPASKPRAACPNEPIAPASGDQDGRFPLQTNVEGLRAADVNSFIVIGNDSAAADRPRDAEAAYLMACRVADRLGGADSAALADAKSQLGTHYVKLASASGVGSNGSSGPGVSSGRSRSPGSSERAALLKRAEPLLSDGLQTSIVLYGEGHEKSKLAARGLAAAREAMAATPAATVTATAIVAPAPAPSLPRAEIRPPPPPVPAPSPQLAARVEADDKPPEFVPPVAEPAPRVSTASPVAAQVKSNQRPAPVNACAPAVATLGLCDPGI